MNTWIDISMLDEAQKKAIVRLYQQGDFAVFLELMRLNLVRTHGMADRLKEDVHLRWAQGACQVMSEIQKLVK